MSDAAKILWAAAFALVATPGLAQETAPADPAAAGQDTAQEAPAAPDETPQTGAAPSQAAPAEGAAPTQAAPAEGAAPSQATGEAPAGLSMGEPATAGEGEIGSTYVREEHGDWQMRCVRTGEERDPCQLYQLLQDEQGNSVAEISMASLPAGQDAAAGATVITPLETLLTAQVALAVDGGQARRYPFTWCSAIGCFSRIGFTQAEVDQFKRGRTATLTVRPVAAPDQTVTLTVSLNGFTAGFEAVRENNAIE